MGGVFKGRRDSSEVPAKTGSRASRKNARETVSVPMPSGSASKAVRHGASASLPQAPRSTCRAWASAIHDQLGDRIDGLLVPSTVTGDPMVVLFARSTDAFPVAPSFSRTLEQADVLTLAVRVRGRLGWPIR